MSMLEFRFDEAKALPLYAGTSAVRGGRLVKIQAVSGNSSPRVKVIETAGSDAAIGAAYADAAIGKDVTVHTRGIMKLVANGAIAVGDEVVPGPGGTVVTAGAGAGGPNVCGRAFSATTAAGQNVWVKFDV